MITGIKRIFNSLRNIIRWPIWRNPLFGATTVTFMILLPSPYFSSLLNDMLAMVIWLFSIITFFIYQYAQNLKRESVDKDNQKQVKTLEKMISTMPPKDFLDNYAKLHNNALKVFKAYKELSQANDDSIEDTEHAICSILDCLVSLLISFEATRKSTVYAANIMTFCSCADYNQLPEEKLKEIEKNVLFLDEGACIKKLKGLLELEANLSITSEQNASLDPNIQNKNFFLPIPMNFENETKYIALPGAPLAFLQEQSVSFSDVNTLNDWCNKNCDFTQQTIQKIVNYFSSENTRYIKSFVSIPLIKQDDKKVIAILNFHKNDIDILNSKEELNQFDCIITPFKSMLIDLLIIRKEKQAIDYKEG